ncbi:MAG: VCBS repeat-containing protein, partial [Promethearchaeota archaeon]
ESAAFGDLDGDGNYDVVVAHGEEFFADSGVSIIWGPNKGQVKYPNAWKTGGCIPSTINKGHFHYIKTKDINGDNSTDIIVGGRGRYPKAGLKWIESPVNVSHRRDLSKWVVHEIDAEIESGHGFVFGDIDSDGDEDIALCNTDWDTPESEEKIIWYQNPGSNNSEQLVEWPKNIIYQSSEFYTKEQVELADFNEDNYPEILIQTQTHIYIFKNPVLMNNSWERISIEKPPTLQWRCRTLKVGDLNNDGTLDLIGMLIHLEGYFPIHKAAVFWMEYIGTSIENATWISHVIKWGDGFLGIGTYNGEKWDQCFLIDLDRDGDKDIIANCEEFHSLGFVFIAVVWFENPLL